MEEFIIIDKSANVIGVADDFIEAEKFAEKRKAVMYRKVEFKDYREKKQ